MRRLTAIFLLVTCLLNAAVPVFGVENNYDHTQIAVVVSKNGSEEYKMIDVLSGEKDIYLTPEQLVELTRYSYRVTEDGRGLFQLGMKTIVLDYKNQIMKVNNTQQSFSGAISLDGEYYLPFSELSPWLNITLDHNDDILRIESDALSYWEVLQDFNPQDYYFIYAEELGDDVGNVVGLTAIHVFDSLLNIDDVWKKVVPVTGIIGDTSIYDYEIYVDTFKEFAIPEDDADDAVGLFKKAAGLFTNYTKLCKELTTEDFHDEIAYTFGRLVSDDTIDTDNPEFYRGMYQAYGEDFLGEYEDWVSKDSTIPEDFKRANKVIRLLNTCFLCMQIMAADTESYARALEYIYFRDNSEATTGERKAAEKVVMATHSNGGTLVDTAATLTHECIKEVLEASYDVWAEAADFEMPKSSIGSYLTLIDTTLSLFWPINKAYGEVAKLPVYTTIQQQAYDAFMDAKVGTGEATAEELELSRMTAIFYLRAAKKCYSAKDKMMSVWGADGLLDYYLDDVQEMIEKFNLCWPAQKHDAIVPKTEEIAAVQELLLKLGVLLEKKPSETESKNPTTPVIPTQPIEETRPANQYPEELLGRWVLFSGDYDDDILWDIQLWEDGTAGIGLGFALSEYVETYYGEWFCVQETGGYTINLSLTGGFDGEEPGIYNIKVFAQLDGEQMRLQKYSGDDVSIVYDQWYERNLDYYTWLDRQNR